MAKRKSDPSDPAPQPTYALPPDPLKTVPRSLLDAAERSGFTVCDMVVVLDEMARLFNTRIYVTGPAEGAIHLLSIPVASWISDKKKSEHAYYGCHTELRFSLSKMNKDSEELVFIQACLSLFDICRNNPNIETTIVRSCDDDMDTILRRISWGNWGRFFKYTDEQTEALLKRPMPLCLRENYPHYTWPRWAFGAFEAFIARRIQLKGAAIVTQIPSLPTPSA